MPRTIRTSLDLPEELHRRLHEVARRRGCSARALILASLEREVAFESKTGGRVKMPLVAGPGEPVNPTSDEIYDVLFS